MRGKCRGESFCSVSQAVQKALNSESVLTSIVDKARGVLQCVVRRNKLKRVWLTCRAGWKSIQRADKLVKLGTKEIAPRSK